MPPAIYTTRFLADFHPYGRRSPSRPASPPPPPRPLTCHPHNTTTGNGAGTIRCRVGHRRNISFFDLLVAAAGKVQLRLIRTERAGADHRVCGRAWHVRLDADYFAGTRTIGVLPGAKVLQWNLTSNISVSSSRMFPSSKQNLIFGTFLISMFWD